VEEYLLNTKEKPNTLNLILKFSDRGIEETIMEQLEGLADKIKQKMDININIISNDVGEVTPGDVKNAKVSSSEIICFGVGLSPIAADSAVENDIDVKVHDLIHSFLK
jgi:translation initiation factor IF-2